MSHGQIPLCVELRFCHEIQCFGRGAVAPSAGVRRVSSIGGHLPPRGLCWAWCLNGRGACLRNSCRATRCGLTEMVFGSKLAEIQYNPGLDLLQGLGFLSTLQAVARRISCNLKSTQLRSLRSGSIWWIGIPCSSWIWLSRGSTGRTFTRPRGLVVKFSGFDLAGERTFKSVKDANRLVRRAVYLFLGCNLHCNGPQVRICTSQGLCLGGGATVIELTMAL